MDDKDPRKSTAASVVALFRSRKIRDNGNGTSTLATEQFGASRHLCPEEPFFTQPVGAFCTGFLVAPTIIATAGHCVRPAGLAEVRFVFGFEMVNETSARLVIDNEEIYRAVEIIGEAEVRGS